MKPTVILLLLGAVVVYLGELECQGLQLHLAMDARGVA